MGWRAVVLLFFACGRGYMYSATPQSSSNSGSSSPWDLSLGSFVDNSARCVVRESNGSGYDNG